MPELFFWLLAAMFAVYVALDGIDFGVGMLHLWIARTPRERVTVMRTVGPIWDGNEVWLVAAGGTLFGAFPVLFATVMPGFYLPVMIVLWLLVFRALAIELRHQLQEPLWHQFWDAAFALSSGALALTFCTAAGNLVRGVSLDEDGVFFAPLWTDFGVGARTGVLDWYTSLVALTGTVALAMHGGTWLRARTDGPLEARARRVVQTLWPVTAALLVGVSAATLRVRPDLLQHAGHPAAAAMAVTTAAALAATRALLDARPRWAFRASALLIASLVLCGALSVYPSALVARDPAHSLDLATAAAPPASLVTMLWWWLPGMALACTYSFVTYRTLPPVFSVEDDEMH